MINGIINVYKEKGYTSFDVVAKLRGIFHQKKIGHTGTLDPDAEGVLPICLGKAAKVCGLLTDCDKEYEAVLLLGRETDTQDISGTVLHQSAVTVSEDEVRTCIAGFNGIYEQVPPMYSALKVNGQKLCDLARKGITIERKARQVTIYEIEILEMSLPRVRMRVSCSKGTYIRTLCQDIGTRLGCYGCMESLLRTRAAGFVLQDAYRLLQIEAMVHAQAGDADPSLWNNTLFRNFILPVDMLFFEYPKAVVSQKAQKLVENGNRIPAGMIEGQTELVSGSAVRLYNAKNEFVGLYLFQETNQELKPMKRFME